MTNACSLGKRKFKDPGIWTSRFIIGCVLIALVIIPLFRMFLYIDKESIKTVFGAENFFRILLNSLTVTAIATSFVLVIAYAIAWSLERTGIKFKKLFGIIIVLPMLIPSISHGMGLIILFGNNGILTKLLKLNANIYGMWGIVFGAVMYAFPVAFLMLRDVMKYEDCSPYEAAEILGIPKWRQFLKITAPYLRKPLIAVIFSVFTMIITDYGVPLMVGGKFQTIPVVMFEEVIGQLNFGRGCVYGMILLIPAVVAFVFDLFNKDAGNSAFVLRKSDEISRPFKNTAAYVICTIVCLFTMLPIVAFAVLAFAKNYPNNLGFTFHNIIRTYDLKGGRYLLNSVIIAFAVSLVGVITAFITAYITARVKSLQSRILHLISITSMAIPGIVLGLAYVITFKNSFFYGTIVILIMVNLIHFFASPYLMMYNSMSKINGNLEAVGNTLGIGRFRMIKDVFLPQSMSTLSEMFAYLFVNCMMTISAVSFLANTSNKPVSLMINQFEAQMQIECIAVVSIAILIINIIIKAFVYLVKTYLSGRTERTRNDYKKTV